MRVVSSHTFLFGVCTDCQLAGSEHRRELLSRSEGNAGSTIGFLVKRSGLRLLGPCRKAFCNGSNKRQNYQPQWLHSRAVVFTGS
jgi:hypothetical protein